MSLKFKTIKKYSISVLDAHDTIALDIDATLINGPCSRIIQNWVSDNHNKKAIHLITFRMENPEWTWRELRNHGLKQDWFAGLHMCDHETAARHAEISQKMRGNAIDSAQGQFELEYAGIDLAYATQCINNYYNWKAAHAKSLGCTVLVDDLQAIVEPGCLLHGVDFVNSLQIHI